MKFSAVFHKAIDAIIPDYEPDYERVLDMPQPLRNGLHVAVFNDGDHSIFVCYGVIISCEWNALTHDYLYEVQVCQSREQVKAWGWHVRHAPPEEMRLDFFKIDGGFPELRRKT